MHRSSESVAALAAALAKAQAQLVNPEKSLTATIRTGRPGDAEQSFRYAPLASGLDIVRKTLGQHEIATVQTTAIDGAAGIINLTTMLAHASGEWIASDWPVCPITDMASPRRMGAALTYARRYALFTLVGIAGEDDLDAPDLCYPGSSSTAPPPARSAGNGRGGAFAKATPPILLGATLSASLREMLLAEIAAIGSSEVAARWAQDSLPRKNSLTAADAKLVEDAFESRLSELPVSERPAPASEQTLPPDTGPVVGTPVAQRVVPDDGAALSPAEHSEGNSATSVDKSVLAVAAPRRYRNREHLRSVVKMPCLVCGRKPSDPHHLRFAQPRALGRKPSDEFTVPLCRMHHREVHRAGDEGAWWKAAGVDPLKVARKLWKETRLDEGRIAQPADRDRNDQLDRHRSADIYSS
jgi:ERF superfamily protein